MVDLFSPWRRAQQMKSDHIDNRRLFEVVNETAILEPTEVEHLSTCEECLEMIRVLIRQNLSKSAEAS